MTTDTDTPPANLDGLDQRAILRAISDPGSFLPRGDYNGERYGESIQHWSMRAVLAVVDQWLNARRVVDLPDPASTGPRGPGRVAVWEVGGWYIARTTYPGEPPTIGILNGPPGVGHGIGFNPDTAVQVAAAVLAAATRDSADAGAGGEAR